MAVIRHWIEYIPDWRQAPMACWVHVPQPGQTRKQPIRYRPEPPAPIPHLGYALVCMEFGRFVLCFSSRPQIEECIRILSQKPLPPAHCLAARLGYKGGLKEHWLSRLPARLKAPRPRDKLVKALIQLLSETTAFRPSPAQGAPFAAGRRIGIGCDCHVRPIASPSWHKMQCHGE